LCIPVCTCPKRWVKTGFSYLNAPPFVAAVSELWKEGLLLLLLSTSNFNFWVTVRSSRGSAHSLSTPGLKGSVVTYAATHMRYLIGASNPSSSSQGQVVWLRIHPKPCCCSPLTWLSARCYLRYRNTVMEPTRHTPCLISRTAFWATPLVAHLPLLTLWNIMAQHVKSGQWLYHTKGNSGALMWNGAIWNLMDGSLVNHYQGGEIF
jgi:hypothetical protein